MRKLYATSVAVGVLAVAMACGRAGTKRFTGDGDGGDGDGDVGDGDMGDGDVGDGDGDATGGMGGMGGGHGTGGNRPDDPSAPSCEIVSPVDAARVPFFGGLDEDGDPTGVEFKAEAIDAEDGPLDGESVVWRRVGSEEPLGSGLTLLVDELPPGENEITCTVIDSDSKTGSDSIFITSVSPVVFVTHPGAFDGNRLSGSEISFAAVGFDFEDGELSSESFAWSSDLEGALGTGDGSYILNSIGAHKITVVAADSDQNEAKASVFVPIVEVPINEPE